MWHITSHQTSHHITSYQTSDHITNQSYVQHQQAPDADPHIQQRKHPQGRSAPLWGAAEGRAFAFLVKCCYSVPEDVHSAWDYAHSVYVWHGSVDYSNNSCVFRWILFCQGAI